MKISTYARLLSLTFLMCLFNLGTAQAQTKEVSGVVISGEDNLPLPGVSILLKGSTSGTVTDVDGKFRISVTSDQSVLVFSFIGFTTQEVLVGARSEISVTLGPDMKSLAEVIVVGYGEQKKETITGSVATVKGDRKSVV